MHTRLWILTLALLAFASAAEAQSVVCSQETSPVSPPALAILGGQTYAIRSASAADGTDRRALGLLKGFSIPNKIGHRGWSPRYERFHGNLLLSSGTAMAGLWHNPGELNPPQGSLVEQGFQALMNNMSEIDPKLRTARTNAWCVSNADGALYVRGGVQLDWRWDWDLEWDAWLPGNDGWNYKGIKVRAQLRSERSGFPVLDYFVEPGREAEADRKADQMYGTANPSTPMSFSTVEFEIWGRVERLELPLSSLMDNEDLKKRFPNCKPPSYPDNKCPANWSYRVSSAGVVQQRQYLDPRIGRRSQPGIAIAPSMLNEMAVEFSPRTIYSTSRATMRVWDDRVHDLCGTTAGCGSVPTRIARGNEYIPGIDDGERHRQMCRTLARNQGHDPRTCDDDPDSDLNRAMGVTDRDRQEIANERGQYNRMSQQEAAHTATSLRTGQRGAGAPSGPSQMERICVRLIREDSARSAAGDTLQSARSGFFAPLEGSSRVPPECERYR